jgi:hypothetical protein
MDNFKVDIVWEGEKRFRAILGMVLDKHNSRTKKFEHYAIDDDLGLILFWAESKNAQKLPYPMDHAALVDFAWNWLKTATYGREPDHDGDNGKGWRIFTESWGRVKGDWATICAIQPIWAMYGK